MSDEPIRVRGFACTRGRGGRCTPTDVTYASMDAMRAAAEPFYTKQEAIFGTDLPPVAPTQPALFPSSTPQRAESKLARIFRASVALARRLGTDQRRTLSNGAEFVIGLRNGRLCVTLKRPGGPLGDVEERVFVEHFGIPRDARRWPKAGQLTKRSPDGELIYWICYAWQDGEAK